MTVFFVAPFHRQGSEPKSSDGPNKQTKAASHGQKSSANSGTHQTTATGTQASSSSSATENMPNGDTKKLSPPPASAANSTQVC